MPFAKFTAQQPKDLLLKASLYERFEFENEENWDVLDFPYLQGTYDNFCVACKRESTFELAPSTRPSEHKKSKASAALRARMTGELPEVTFAPTGVQRIEARCARHKGHTQYFIFLVEQHFESEPQKRMYSTIQKIGQYPSYGDVHIDSVKKYAPVLSKVKRSELVRALGLASHDVGIGSYVYLRRIFESLIEEAHNNAQGEHGWNEDAYARARVSEKIALLKHQLPPFLVENPQIYGLLSKGIHELSEEECLKHFDTLRLGIEIILEERLAHYDREKKMAEARAALSKIGAGK